MLRVYHKHNNVEQQCGKVHLHVLQEFKFFNFLHNVTLCHCSSSVLGFDAN